jgi:hypothetical protein
MVQTMEILAATLLANGLDTGREHHRLCSASFEKVQRMLNIFFLITDKEFKHGKALLRSMEKLIIGWEELLAQAT